MNDPTSSGDGALGLVPVDPGAIARQIDDGPDAVTVDCRLQTGGRQPAAPVHPAVHDRVQVLAPTTGDDRPEPPDGTDHRAGGQDPAKETTVKCATHVYTWISIRVSSHRGIG